MNAFNISKAGKVGKKVATMAQKLPTQSMASLKAPMSAPQAPAVKVSNTKVMRTNTLRPERNTRLY